MIEKNGAYIHETAIVDEGAKVGVGTHIWHYSHVRAGAVIGKNCHIGQNTYVDDGAVVGNGVKLQNNVSVYDDVELEDYVFCGPSMVFTNDLTPRARYPKGHQGYKKTIVHHDATIGANATIVCGHELGEYCTIAAGAVVTKNVKPHALIAGVPAEQVGWVCDCGQVLRKQDDFYICNDCGRKYVIIAGKLQEYNN